MFLIDDWLRSRSLVDPFRSRPSRSFYSVLFAILLCIILYIFIIANTALNANYSLLTSTSPEETFKVSHFDKNNFFLYSFIAQSLTKSAILTAVFSFLSGWKRIQAPRNSIRTCFMAQASKNNACFGCVFYFVSRVVYQLFASCLTVFALCSS